MKILKKPTYPIQKCEFCGCEFKIKTRDIEKDGFSLIKNIVRCPVCQKQQNVVVNKPCEYCKYYETPECKIVGIVMFNTEHCLENKITKEEKECLASHIFGSLEAHDMINNCSKWRRKENETK